MACTREEVITILEPILIALRANTLVTANMLRVLNSGVTVPALLNTIEGVRPIANIASQLGSDSLGNIARKRAQNIVATIANALDVPPTTQLYIDSFFSNVPASEIFRTAAYGLLDSQIEKIEEEIAARYGIRRGSIAAALSAINNLIAGGDPAARGYLSYLFTNARRHNTVLRNQLFDMDQHLFGMESILFNLYDSARLEDLMWNTEGAVDSLKQSDGYITRVIEGLEGESAAFDDRAFSLAVDLANEARGDILPRDGSLPLRALSGRTQSALDITIDIANVGKSISSLQSLGKEGLRSSSYLLTLLTSIITFEDEWSQAAINSTRHTTSLRSYQARIGEIIEEMEALLRPEGESDNSALISKQGRWSGAISLALGELLTQFSPSQRETLRTKTVLTQSRAAYEVSRFAVQQAGLIEFDPLMEPINKVIANAPAVLAGASRQSDTMVRKAAQLRVDIRQARRHLGEARSISSQLDVALNSFPVYDSSLVGNVFGTLEALRMGGWRTLLSLGRISLISPTAAATITSTGLAISCLTDLSASTPPALRASIQKLLGIVRGINTQEEQIAFSKENLSQALEARKETEEQANENLIAAIDDVINNLDETTIIGRTAEQEGRVAG